MSKPLCALSLSVLALTSISRTALADQCAWNTKAIADRAAELVKPGATVIEFCEPCSDDRPGPSVAVKSTRVTQPKTGYFELTINRKAVDLAYLFVKTADNVFTNVGVLAGCDPHDVSTEIRDGKPTKFRSSKQTR